MRTRNSLYLIVIFISCFLVADLCLAKNVDTDGPCVEKIYKNPYLPNENETDTLGKSVPLYRFKPDVTGRFLERFCDSLGIFWLYDYMVIDEVEKLNFPHEGDVDEYVYVSTEIMTPENASGIKAAIMLPSAELIVLNEVNDRIVNLLHIEEDGCVSLRFIEEGCMGTSAIIETSALLHIMPNGKVDPVNISDNRVSTFDRKYGWIIQYFTDNGFDSRASYEYHPLNLVDFAFLSDSVPKKIITGGDDGHGKPQDCIEIKIEDIIKLKNRKNDLKYRIIFSPKSVQAVKKRMEYIKYYYSNGDRHLNPDTEHMPRRINL